MKNSFKIEIKNGIQTFYAKSKDEWRKWLDKNGQTEKSVWLIIYHKKSKTPSVNYQESIEHALCFGWIDSKAIKRNEESFYLFFTPRKPNSNWSKVNRERVMNMIDKGFMTPSGQTMIDLAKKTGTWDALSDFQNLILPDDLQNLFDKNKTALKNYQVFPPSSKRMILEWIANAKKPETRKKRIIKTVELAADNIRANHPKQ